MMKILADENIDFRLIKLLRENHIDVLSVAEIKFGITDIEVINLANEHNCLLITEDKDFGELSFRLQLIHKGILLLRVNSMASNVRNLYILENILQFYNEMINKFSVLNEKMLRIK